MDKNDKNDKNDTLYPKVVNSDGTCTNYEKFRSPSNFI